MRLSEKQIDKMVALVFKELKANNAIEFKEKEEVVFQKAVALVKGDFRKEEELNQEVNDMMDDLERTNPGSFQRYKMFPLLKKRLAKEKGVVL